MRSSISSAHTQTYAIIGIDMERATVPSLVGVVAVVVVVMVVVVVVVVDVVVVVVVVILHF